MPKLGRRMRPCVRLMVMDSCQITDDSSRGCGRSEWAMASRSRAAPAREIEEKHVLRFVTGSTRITRPFRVTRRATARPHETAKRSSLYSRATCYASGRAGVPLGNRWPTSGRRAPTRPAAGRPHRPHTAVARATVFKEGPPSAEAHRRTHLTTPIGVPCSSSLTLARAARDAFELRHVRLR